MSCLMGLSVASALGVDLGSGLSPPSGGVYRWSQQEVIEGSEAPHSSLSGKRGLRGTAVAFPPFPPHPQATQCISHTAPSREGHDTGFQGGFQLDFLVCTTATPSTRWEVRHGRRSNYAMFPGLEKAVHLERLQGVAVGAALSQVWARSQADLEQATS